MAEELFPLGIAEGAAFCNRVEERKELRQHIKTRQHTVLLAPRRYGKTSLLIKVVEETKIPYCIIDFLMAGSHEDVSDHILERIGYLVAEILPKLKKSKKNIFDLFRRFRPEITLTALGQTLKLHAPDTPRKSIVEVLVGLDNLAQKVNKKIVVVMDEFQQLSLLQDNLTLEATIRHAAERAKNVTYIFSGSKRHLLSQMFTGESRPLYRLCRLMSIDKIQASDHTIFIQTAAKKRWRKKLSSEVLDEIFFLTEYHSFYVNALCRSLWDSKKYPSIEEVLKLWKNYVKSQKPIIEGELIELSPNQKIVLKALALKPNKALQSNSFTSKVSLSSSSVKQAIDVLIRKDFVYINEEKFYCVHDPAIKYFLVYQLFF